MARHRKNQAGPDQTAEQNQAGPEQTAKKVLRCKFVDSWHSDRGSFSPGSEAEMPAEIALSLKKEGVVTLKD